MRQVVLNKEKLMANNEITYWPKTGQVFAGKHIDRLPTDLEPLAVIHGNNVSTSNAGFRAAAKFVAENKGKGLSQALMATDIGANAENLLPLQLVQLVKEAQGRPEDFFYLDEAFLRREINALELRETVRSVGSTVERVGRMQHTPETRVTYMEYQHDITKLKGALNVPMEDSLRTVINPKTVEMENLEHDFRFKRNQDAAREIKKTTWNVEGKTTSGEDLGSLSGIASNGFHSDNRFATHLNSKINDFVKYNRVMPTHIIMHPDTYSWYTENTWTRAGPVKLDPERVAKGGVFQLPGIKNLIAIADMEIEKTRAYVVNKTWGMRVGEGPKYMRVDWDRKVDSEVSTYLDFVDYINVDAKLNDESSTHEGINGRYFSFMVHFDIPGIVQG